VQRLADARGQPVGPNRVWLADAWVPGLAMSRAIGDIVAHTVGVSSEPETSTVELCPQDKWLILATDGVWEFIDPQAAIDIVGGCKDAEEACRTLVDCAWAKWLQEEEGVVDDITVVAVKLNPV
jgi:serine/threonine protein phosphatase PrpC